MSHFVREADIGSAWLSALGVINDSAGSAVNLVVTISDPLCEDLGVRVAIENTLAELKAEGRKEFANVQSMHTVANTIFPVSLYRPEADGAAERFLENAVRSEEARSHLPPAKRQWGTYIGRLVRYPARDGGYTNQLAEMLQQLRAQRHWSDLYEMPLVVPDDEHEVLWDTTYNATGALTHGDARLDARMRGGPCLAHLSGTLENGRLSLVTLYRRHSYLARAYGNFLGLGRLLAFLAHESGHDVGELMVVASHAVVDGPHGRQLHQRAVDACGDKSRIETSSRPLGASWSDLELPSIAP